MATVSLRAAARHLETSVESVRRAIKAGRLARSLVVEGGQQRIDLAIVEQEWQAARSVQQVAQRVRHAEPAPAVPAEDCPAMTFAVLRDGNRVLLCEAIGDPPDPDGWIYSLTLAGALELAGALVKRANDPTQTFAAAPGGNT
jgi:hypothetical protein